jgi:hypothetical protein
MAQEQSKAIEEAFGRGQTNILVRCYEFDLVKSEQTNVQTKKVRKIRRSEEMLSESNKALHQELARAKEEATGASSEIERLRKELTASKKREQVLKHDLEKRAGENKSQRVWIKRYHTRLAKANESRVLERQLIQEKNREISSLSQDLENARRERACAAGVANSQIESLTEERGGLTARLDGLVRQQQSLGFQAAVSLLLQANRPDPTKRAACSLAWPPADQFKGQDTLSADRILCSFGTYVADAFRSTAAHHRKTFDPSSHPCPAPEFEVLRVDALTCPDLADLFQHYVKKALVRESRGWGQHAAHRVAKPSSQMRLLNRVLGADMWDETVLLGWHGAEDATVAEILSDGFNPFCAGSGAGTLFGKGIYFAENSSKADLYAGPKERRFKKHEGEMTVILSAVFCGNMHEAKATMRDVTKPPLPTDAETRGSGINRFAAPQRFNSLRVLINSS